MITADELHEQAIWAYNAGEFDRAESLIRSALEIDGQNPNIHINLANTLIAKGRHSAALLTLSTATALAPDISVAHYLKAVVLEEMKNPDAALASANTALALEAHSVKALILRGNLLLAKGATAAAIADHQRAIALDSENALAHFNLACALSADGRLEDALIEYDAALSIFADFVQAHCNKANALRDLMRIREALASYERALELAPTNHQLRWNLSLLQLQQADFQRGWQNYEHRLIDPAYTHISTSAARWDGTETIEGKTILVIGEQGLGDMIQFSRYIPQLHQLGAQVILQVPDSLAALFKNLAGVNATLPMQATPPETDLYCMLMSLPAIFKTEIDTIPYGNTAYLAPSANALSQWQTSLKKNQRTRVGLVTRGNPRNQRDAHRRINLDNLVQILPHHIDYFLLHDQLHIDDQQVLIEHPQIHSIHAQVHDFNDTAAACSQMDLIITVDTALAHLAGALGAQTWIMIPFASDWRWFLQRDDSPWYPKVRLFRQTHPNEWDTVLHDIHHALIEFAQNADEQRKNNP